MFLKSTFNYINEFYFIFKNQIRKVYLNSSIYNRKISKVDENVLVYQPSLNILSSLIKYKKQYHFDIEVDGGINFSNSKIVLEAGADILVSGTTVFKENNGDIKTNIEKLKSM